MYRQLHFLLILIGVVLLLPGSAASADPQQKAVELATIGVEIAIANATAIETEALALPGCAPIGPSCGGDEENIACTVGLWAGEVEPARAAVGSITVHAKDVLTGDSVCTNPDIFSGDPEYEPFLEIELLWYDRNAPAADRWKQVTPPQECKSGTSILGQGVIPTCNLVFQYTDPLDERQYAPRKGTFRAGYYSPIDDARKVKSTREFGPLAPVLPCVICDPSWTP